MAIPTDEELRAAAIEKHVREGEVEIDDDALVSRGDEAGDMSPLGFGFGSPML